MSYLTYSSARYPKRELENPYKIKSPDVTGGNVVLFLKGNGENASTNIVDSSLNPKNITIIGNVTISTAQSKYGGSSILANGGELRVNSNNEINFEDKDFTIEFWFYPISNTEYSCIITGDGADYPFSLYWGGLVNSNRPVWAFGTSTSWFYQGNYLQVPPGKWTHYAVTRQDNIFRIFQDGILIDSQAATGTIGNAGNLSIFSNGSFRLNAYIDSLRITTEAALYTSNFNPETDTFLDS